MTVWVFTGSPDDCSFLPEPKTKDEDDEEGGFPI